MEKFSQKVKQVIGSRWFFWTIFIFFVVEAIWTAVSARYPMAFDENYHFGIVKLYANQLSPFFDHQPASANVFG